MDVTPQRAEPGFAFGLRFGAGPVSASADVNGSEAPMPASSGSAGGANVGSGSCCSGACPEELLDASPDCPSSRAPKCPSDAYTKLKLSAENYFLNPFESKNVFLYFQCFAKFEPHSIWFGFQA